LLFVIVNMPVIYLKNGSVAWAVGRWKNPEKMKPSKHFCCTVSHVWDSTYYIDTSKPLDRVVKCVNIYCVPPFTFR